MPEDRARALVEGQPLELYLSTITDSAWGRAHKSRLRRHPLPRSKKELIALLDTLKPAAKRSYWVSLRLYAKWAKQRDLADPTEGVIPPPSTPSRDRVLTQLELKKIWQVTDFPGFGHYVRVLLLSAQRREEVTGFSWVDVQDGVWTNRGKGGAVNLVPIASFQEYLGDTWNPTTSYSKSKAKLDRSAGVYGWTLHDLRRTAASEMARLGVNPFVVERVLGHKLKGVEGVYNRYGYLKEKQEALLVWSLCLEDLA